MVGCNYIGKANM